MEILAITDDAAVLRDGREVTAVLRLEADLVGTGTARCKPGDHFDARIGKYIAIGRAMQDLGRQLEEHGAARSITEEQAVNHATSCLMGLGD